MQKKHNRNIEVFVKKVHSLKFNLQKHIERMMTPAARLQKKCGDL